MSSLRRHDLKLLRKCAWLCGVDEAGRGPLAGPVVAGAVILNRAFFDSRWARRELADVNDSKQLTESQREEFFEAIQQARDEDLLSAAAGVATVAEIESENILGATRLAMGRAISAADRAQIQFWNENEQVDLFSGDSKKCGLMLIDGRPMRPFPYPHQGLVGGDHLSFSIALASVVAKVTRDRMMVALDREFPVYGFSGHKGYGTEAHRAAIREHGPCPHHRPLFLRKILSA